jgi:hypothetical protein
LQSKLWENDEMTEEEAEEVMKKAELLKIKMVRASERMKQWGMETGLNRSAKRHARTHASTRTSRMRRVRQHALTPALIDAHQGVAQHSCKFIC